MLASTSDISSLIKIRFLQVVKTTIKLTTLNGGFLPFILPKTEARSQMEKHYTSHKRNIPTWFI